MMHRDLEDERSNRDVLLCIERRLNHLQGKFLMDLYDRIIAGVLASQSGDNGLLQQHVAAIDNHLSQVDADTLQLEGDDEASKSRLDAIEAGLAKIADSIAPPAPSTSVSTSVSTSDSAPASTSDSVSTVVSTSDSVSTAVSTSDSAPADGSGSGDVTA